MLNNVTGRDSYRCLLLNHEVNDIMFTFIRIFSKKSSSIIEKTRD